MGKVGRCMWFIIAQFSDHQAGLVDTVMEPARGPDPCQPVALAGRKQKLAVVWITNTA